MADDDREAKPVDASLETVRPGTEDTLVRELPPTVERAIDGPRSSPDPRPGLGDLPLVSSDSYEVTGEFARGGLGRILSARDAVLDRPVALKELLVGDPASAERFLREALTTARLQHPNIVPVYEAGRWPSGSPFYAMKMVSGQSLDRVIREARSLDGRLALIPNVLAVAEAIAYAHQQRIIHRDLKPANVLVGSFGETVVIDWGLTKDLAAHSAPGDVGAGPRAVGSPGSASPTMDGSIMGTPSYMPPEQAAGEPVDERADVYALGAVLYHVLAGRPPYEGGSGFAILRAVLAGPPAPLEERQSGVPGDLVAITKKAMARDPADRYPSAKELAEDLRRFQTGQLVGAHRYSLGELVARWIRRNLALVLVASAAIAFFAVGAGVSVRRIIEERDRANMARAAAEAARRSEMDRHDELVLVEARHALESDPTAALAWLKRLSPESSRWTAARVIAADARDRGVARVLRGHEGRVYRVAFAPGGDHLASWGEDRTLRIWDIEGRALRVVGEVGATSDIRDGAIGFTPDGKSLSARLGGSISLFDVERAEKTFETPRAEVEDSDPRRRSASLDGTRVAIASGRTIRVLDRKTGDRHQLRAPNALGAVEPLLSPDGRRIAIVADQTIRVVDLDSERDAKTAITGSMRSEIHRVRFSPNGRRLACAARLDREILVFDLDTGQKRMLEGHTDPVRALELSPDGGMLASVGSFDGLVRIWDIDAGTSVTKKADPSAMTFSPDARRLAMAITSKLAILDLRSDERIDLIGHSDEITSIAFSPDGERVATSDFDRTVRVWDISRPRSLAIAAAEPGQVPRFAISPDGRAIAIAGLHGGVRIGEVASGRLESDLAIPAEHAVLAVSFGANGDTLLAAEGDGAVRAYLADPPRPADPRILCKLGITPDLDLTFSADGRFFAASGPYAPEASLCDLSTGLVTKLGARGEGLVRYLAFSLDGSRLATAGRDQSIRIWSTATASVTSTLRGQEAPISSLAFSPDGRSIASGDVRDVRMWDLTSGTSVILRGHNYLVTSLAFSRDGAALASSADDWTVRYWDLETKETRPLVGHLRQNVARAVFAGSTRTIVSAGDDGTVRVWRDDLATEPRALSTWLHRATNAEVAPDGTLSAGAE
jgi:eukaryotic-like serine/threonine-protein kinase